MITSMNSIVKRTILSMKDGSRQGNTCILSRVVDGCLSYPSSKAERVGMNFSNSTYFMVGKLSKLATIEEMLLS